MHELTITISEDNIVYLTGYDEEGMPLVLQRLEPWKLTVEDYRRVKPKRWWNL